MKYRFHLFREGYQRVGWSDDSVTVLPCVKWNKLIELIYNYNWLIEYIHNIMFRCHTHQRRLPKGGWSATSVTVLPCVKWNKLIEFIYNYNLLIEYIHNIMFRCHSHQHPHTHTHTQSADVFSINRYVVRGIDSLTHQGPLSRELWLLYQCRFPLSTTQGQFS